MPEKGPSTQMGSQADLIWTFPDPNNQSGRIMGVELFRGRINPLMNSPFEGDAVTVRGFPATLGSIEEGLALLWEESTEACDRYALTSYGLNKEELLQFANGLKQSAQDAYKVSSGKVNMT